MDPLMFRRKSKNPPCKGPLGQSSLAILSGSIRACLDAHVASLPSGDLYGMSLIVGAELVLIPEIGSRITSENTVCSALSAV